MEIIDEDSLFEMALKRQDAIDRCISLGVEFAKHFNKVMSLGKTDKDFNHHCQEMQSWYDKVRSIKIKNTNKPLSKSQLWDWFFTAGQDSEDLVDQSLVELYEKFYLKLVSDENQSVKEVISELL